MDKKFLVIFNSTDEKDTAMWWENQYKQNFEASVFESFDTAKKFMRSEICDLFADNDEALLEHLFEGFCDESDEALEFFHLRNLVKSLLTQPNSFSLEIHEMQFTDDGDHYFAFVCNDKYILVDNYDWCLKTNVHIMDKENNYYYFEVYNNEECIVSFKLINTEKTIDDCTDDVEETVEWKQISFGSFIQTDGEIAEPIAWDVISETDDKYFVISHSCLDYRVFNDGRNSSNWEKSELRKWLNGEFYESSFSEAEKSRILLTTVSNGKEKATKDNIFLLNEEEFFMLDVKNMRAGLTKYARARYSEAIYQPYKEPHGFWWLREYNKDKGGYDLTHVCANGTLNDFARSDSSHPNGIRPAMWVKK